MWCSMLIFLPRQLAKSWCVHSVQIMKYSGKLQNECSCHSFVRFNVWTKHWVSNWLTRHDWLKLVPKKQSSLFICGPYWVVLTQFIAPKYFLLPSALKIAGYEYIRNSITTDQIAETILIWWSVTKQTLALPWWILASITHLQNNSNCIIRTLNHLSPHWRIMQKLLGLTDDYPVEAVHSLLILYKFVPICYRRRYQLSVYISLRECLLYIKATSNNFHTRYFNQTGQTNSVQIEQPRLLCISAYPPSGY